METTYLIGIRPASPLLEAEVRLQGREHAVDLIHLLLDVELGPDVHVAVRDELLGVGHVEVEAVHAVAVHQPLQRHPGVVALEVPLVPGHQSAVSNAAAPASSGDVCRSRG